jgi:lactose/L-arabinose transport system permease protein
VLVFCAALSVIGTLQLFTEPYLITNGGPGNATMTLGIYLYQQGFRSYNFGYASAVAYAVALLCGAFSWLQTRWMRDT